MRSAIPMKKKRPSRQSRKPTGTVGPFLAQVDSVGGIQGGFQRVSFPEGKDEIESYIVDRFLFSMNQALAPTGEQFLLHSPQKNPEDDFDFNIMEGDKPAYLELTEIVSSDKMGRGGYPDNAWSCVGP